MRIRVLLFASAADSARTREISVHVPAGATAADAVDSIVRELPSLAPMAPSLAVAVNARLAAHDQTLAEGDVIALLPPVSGG